MPSARLDAIDLGEREDPTPQGVPDRDPISLEKHRLEPPLRGRYAQAIAGTLSTHSGKNVDSRFDQPADAMSPQVMDANNSARSSG